MSEIFSKYIFLTIFIMFILREIYNYFLGKRIEIINNMLGFRGLNTSIPIKNIKKISFRILEDKDIAINWSNFFKFMSIEAGYNNDDFYIETEVELKAFSFRSISSNRNFREKLLELKKLEPKIQFSPEVQDFVEGKSIAKSTVLYRSRPSIIFIILIALAFSIFILALWILV